LYQIRRDFRGAGIDGLGVARGVGIGVRDGDGVGVRVLFSFPVRFKLAISEAKTLGIPIPNIKMITNIIACRFMSYVYSHEE
jgi:hypothetical protein